MSLADSMKLLPWCVSTAVPLHYVSRLMATVTQPDEDIPTASEPEESPNGQLSRENEDDFNMDTASVDCISCLDTDEVSV